MQILKKVGEREILKEIPDMYVEGKGVRYGSRKKGIKLVGNLVDIIGEKPSREDMEYMYSFLRICSKNYYASQTLMKCEYSHGRKMGSIMDTEYIAKVLGKSVRASYRLLNWCEAKGLIKRVKEGKKAAIIVNPLVVIMSSRINAVEYKAYEQELVGEISERYVRMLKEELKYDSNGDRPEFE